MSGTTPPAKRIYPHDMWMEVLSFIEDSYEDASVTHEAQMLTIMRKFAWECGIPYEMVMLMSSPRCPDCPFPEPSPY